MLTEHLHAHTWRCHHATGTEREYVEEAIKKGLKRFGFSDHSPYVFEGDYYSTFRMRPDQLEDYVKTVLDLNTKTTSSCTWGWKRNTIRASSRAFCG